MAGSTNGAAPSQPPVSSDAPLVLSVQVIDAYEAMIESVPEAGQDGFEGILEAIALAGDWRALDAPWRSSGMTELANQALVVTGIRKMPSDYPGGLPWFLVIDGANMATGERIAVTTGAVSVVAQLVKAHQLDLFPLVVIPRVADRPSKSGYYPVHLEVRGPWQPAPQPAAATAGG